MEIVLLWCFVLAWMTKRGAEDLVHAVKGTPNPRYEIKKAKARAASQPVKAQPRYATKEWAADLLSDALVAHTEKRRQKAAAKGQPVDDMVDVVREPRPAQAAEPRVVTCGVCLRSRVVGQPCATCEFYDEQNRISARKLAAEKARRPVEHGEPEWLTPSREEMDGPSSVVHDDQHPYCLEPCGPNCTLGVGRAPQVQREEKAGSPKDAFDRVEGLTAAGGGATGASRASATCGRCGRKFDPMGKPGCSCVPQRPRGTYYAHESFVCDGCGEKRLIAGRMEIPGGGVHCVYCQRYGPTADETLAKVIQFPHIKKIEKEISMSNPEATGLTTAIAFADAAADAHQTFSTAGSEGYAGALAQMGFGDGITALAAEAREASQTATAKWAALSSAMQEFMQGREFYANNPDAPEKVALINE